MYHVAAANDTEEDIDRGKMFTTKVTIKGLLKFLNSHLVGGTAIACELSRSPGPIQLTKVFRYM